MAEAIILPLATSILRNIATFTGDYVTEEIKGYKWVKVELRGMADDLESIKAVLHDAESKQYTNAAMKIWLRDLKSVFYDIDDLLDEVSTDVKQNSLNKGLVLPKLGYYLSFKPLVLRLDLSHKLKDLRLELDRIVAKKTKFGLTNRPIEAPSVKRDAFDSCGYVNKLAILGRDEAKNDLLKRISGLGHESSLSVLPIVGMGGIGKTALAKLVYNDIDQFDLKLWVCVSDKFDIQKILQEILIEASREDLASHNLGELVERLREVLNGKKFFLVLDDLWEDDIRLWMKLKSILAVGGTGSAILITTRVEKVALTTQTTEPYNLEKLPDSVCWCIFKNVAFAEGEEERYPRLCEIGLSIVEKCCGNPLVVQCVGSLLRSEKDEGVWLRIKDMDSLNKLDGRYDMVKQLLKLSYDKLPSHLKPIFAHLSLFCKDTIYVPHFHSYFCSALGALQLTDGSFLKHNFVQELLSRSMIQDPIIDFINTIDTFKIHDLLHDLAVDVIGEELAVVTRNEVSAPDASRYITWAFDLADKEFPKQVKAKKARAFIFHYQISNVSRCFLKGIISNMPCLRVLDFGGSQFEELPSSIGNLKHLRSLDIRNNALIKSLPNTVCELVNLECFTFGGCEQLQELPSEMYKLISLRFLMLTTCQRSLSGTKFNRLPSLRHLSIVSCTKLESLWDSDDIGCLTTLRSLDINNCPSLASLPNSTKQLVELEELIINNCQELDLARGDGDDGPSELKSLKLLLILGVPRLLNVPYWLQSATSLQKLFIVNCSCFYSLSHGICHLKSLQLLKIQNCQHITVRCGADEGNLYLIRHVPEIWLDGIRLIPNQQ